MPSELQPILTPIRRWWWLIILPVVIAAPFTLPAVFARADAGGFTSVITYSAVQQFDAIPRAEGDYQDIWLSAELTVDAFTEWVRGSRFREEIIAHADDTPLEAAAIGIAADNQRSIGRIYLSYPTADGIEALSRAVFTVLTTRSQDYFAQLGGVPAQVTLLGETGAVPAPPPLTDRFAPLLRLALAGAGGLLLAFLAHALDPLIRQRAEVEAIGLPVIGSIPRR